MSSTSGTAANIVETDAENLAKAELSIVLVPLNNFLTALQEPGVNTETVAQDFAKLQLAAINDIPQLEAVGIQQVAKDLQSQLDTLIASTSSGSGSGAA